MGRGSEALGRQDRLKTYDCKRRLEALAVLLQVDRGAVLEEEAARNNIGVRAGYILNDVMDATLVGAGDEVRDLLEKSRVWLTAALERGELRGLRAAFRRNLALCEWLRGGEAQADQFRLACIELEESLDRRREPWKGIHELDVDWYIGYAAQARYEPALARYESHPKCTSVVSPKKLNSPRALGYLLLQHALRSNWSEGEIDAACARLLKARVPLWLEHGGYLEAAMWLKISYSDRGPRLQPEAALQKAFDFVSV